MPNLVTRYTSSWTRPDFIATVIIALYFIAGIFVTADYGVNWDDVDQRSNGLTNVRFLLHHDKNALINSMDRYHGPAFELLLVSVEKGLHITGTHSIYYMRHFMVFLFFTATLIVFYHFGRSFFQNGWTGLLCILLLLLMPRILGEGFYNPKDIPFMCAMIWTMYSLLLFYRRPSIGVAIFHAFTCALATDIRVIGILFAPITVCMWMIAWYSRRDGMRASLTVISLYFIFLSCFMILMWPVLMLGPLHQLREAYRQMSNYVGWDGYNLYMGHAYRASQTPWHYHWIWILFTTPEVYIILFAAGMLTFLARMIFCRPIELEKFLFIGISIFFFFFPLVFRSITRGVVYDGWRHMYFVYPFLAIIACYGIDQILSAATVRIRYAGIALVTIALLDSAQAIVRMHPFEYVYFNRTAQALYHPMFKNFDVDYWGVSYKQGFEYLAANVKAPGKILIAADNTPGNRNYEYLTPALRERFEMTSYDSASYFLTNFRDLWAPVPADPPEAIYVQGSPVMGIYKLK